ncbi:YibE/F family protein, partial [Patescibacteria group bacterium]
AVLFGFVFPQILNGLDPVLATVIGSIVILLVNMHLSHGINKKTFVAFLSTFVGLILVYVFAKFFVALTQLSGQASDEAALLFQTTDQIALPAGLLLATIILGATGVLDDITITQSETVGELIDTNPAMDRKEIYQRAMRIGRHHIASVVNTLVLAYAGVAMPLFLLFMLREDIGILRFINEEVVAEEIVRTIAGTLALVLLVPLSTWFAVMAQKKR